MFQRHPKLFVFMEEAPFAQDGEAVSTISLSIYVPENLFLTVRIPQVFEGLRSLETLLQMEALSI